MKRWLSPGRQRPEPDGCKQWSGWLLCLDEVGQGGRLPAKREKRGVAGSAGRRGPDSYGTSLRGFKQAGDILRFLFCKDHSDCLVGNTSESGQTGSRRCKEANSMAGMAQPPAFRVQCAGDFVPCSAHTSGGWQGLERCHLIFGK